MMSFPGNANHEMGTARMGHDPKTSVLNKFNQMDESPQRIYYRWFLHDLIRLSQSFYNLHGAYSEGL
jgi:hypothetical protein